MRKQEESIWFELLFFLIAFLVILRLPNSLMNVAMFIFFLLIIFYCDDSGIRMAVVKKIPKGFPFYKYLAKRRKIGDHITQCYKTATYLCLLLCIPLNELKPIFVGMAIVIPILAIIRYIRYSAQIGFAPPRGKAFSSTAMTIFVPACVFLLATIDNQEYNTLFWGLSISMFLAIVIPFFLYTVEYKKKKSVMFVFLLFVIMFSFGSICIINKAYDFGEREEYKVRIQDKDEYHGKTTDYVVVVSPWDEQKENVSISVSQEEYESVKIGDLATIVQSDGALNMKWYYLELDD